MIYLPGSTGDRLARRSIREERLRDNRASETHLGERRSSLQRATSALSKPSGVPQRARDRPSRAARRNTTRALLPITIVTGAWIDGSRRDEAESDDVD